MPNCLPDLIDQRDRVRRSEVLKAQHRLRRSADFDVVVRHGVRAGRVTLVVHMLVSEDVHASQSPVSVGFVVGRVVGGAVVRNGVRRRLRHLMAQRLSRLPAGARVVVRALPASAAASSDVLAADLDSALDRALARLERSR